MSGRARPAPADVTELYSPGRATFFRAYFARYVRRHMNALRVQGAEAIRSRNEASGPLVVYTNHPGWWDGALYVLLPGLLCPRRRAYAPIEQVMLDRYGIFARIGGFGVDLDSARGGAAFLRQTRSILSRPDSLLWISAQGRFVDVRRRPVGIMPGVGRLCEIAPEATLVPAAFEYPFWGERGAEALVRFGEPMGAGELAHRPRDERLAFLEARLTETMDALALDALSREPSRFETVVSGARGVGGIYDGWRRLLALWRGESWNGGHEFERDRRP
jgi:hypothetical protein